MYIQYQNLNNDKALGVEAAIIYDFTKWFKLNWSATFYNYRLEDMSSEGVQERTSNNWDTRFVASFKLRTKTRLQLDLAYDSPSVTAQGRAEDSYYADFSIKQEFFKNKFTATLKLGDIFATQKENLLPAEQTSLPMNTANPNHGFYP
ncbi:MAG: outer membrane beta-barrel protein [Bacteroidales bacterium]